MSNRPGKIRLPTIQTPWEPVNRKEEPTLRYLVDVLRELERDKQDGADFSLSGATEGDILVANGSLVFTPRKTVPFSFGVGTNLSVTGNVVVTGNASVGGNLLVTGDAFVSGTVKATQTQGVTRRLAQIQPTSTGHGPFVWEVCDATFTSTVDPVSIFGYNLKEGSQQILAGEVGLSWMIEADYYDGVRRTMEVYLEYCPSSGTGRFRPLFININRDTDELMSVVLQQPAAVGYVDATADFHIGLFDPAQCGLRITAMATQSAPVVDVAIPGIGNVFVITELGRVGVGTASPQYRVEIGGSPQTTALLGLSPSTVANGDTLLFSSSPPVTGTLYAFQMTADVDGNFSATIANTRSGSGNSLFTLRTSGGNPILWFLNNGVSLWQMGLDSPSDSFFIYGLDRYLSLAQHGLLTLLSDTANTASVQQGLTVRHRSSGTPAAGFGNEARFQLKSSTTNDRDAGGLSYEWEVATEGSQIGLGRLTANYITTPREVMQWGATSTKPKVGFLGATRAVQQTGGAATAGAAYTATEQAMIQAAYDCLRTFGFLS
jgi:hypothetical protein